MRVSARGSRPIIAAGGGAGAARGYGWVVAATTFLTMLVTAGAVLGLRDARVARVAA